MIYVSYTPERIRSYRYCIEFGPPALIRYNICKTIFFTAYNQYRSTKGCSNLKSPETRPVQERLVSTLNDIYICERNADFVYNYVAKHIQHV